MIFISYAWKNGEPDKRVLEFVATLRELGYEAICDVILIPNRTSMDFNQMIQENMQLADKVIIVLSSKYKEKADAFSGGVGKEYRYVLQDMVHYPQKYILCTYQNLNEEDVRRAIVPTYFRDRELLHIEKDMKKILHRLNNVGEYSFPDVNTIKLQDMPIIIKGHHDLEINVIRSEEMQPVDSNCIEEVLDERIRTYIHDHHDQEKLIVWIKQALLGDREMRREVHLYHGSQSRSTQTIFKLYESIAGLS